MIYHVTVAGRTFTVELGSEGLTVDGGPAEADLRRIPGTRVHSLLLDGASHRVVAERADGDEWRLFLRGRPLPATVVDERTRAIREMTGAAAGPGGPTPLRAPMPGLVVKVEAEVGDRVEPGQGLVIVEAMKMENELRAEAPGVVSKIRVEEGAAVEKGQILIDFEEADE